MTKQFTRNWLASVLTASAGLVIVMAVAYVGSSIMGSGHAATTGWSWQMSSIHGGGTAQVIATDPANAGYATVGGDSWGVYNTKTAGNDWLPAMKGLGISGQNDVTEGDFFFMGMAYSKKVPGRVYALTGKLGNTGAGGFGYVEGNSYHVLTRAVSGAEGTGACGDRTVRPRCTGNRVIVDYDTASGTEYIYAAEGNGDGVARSTDGGNSWTNIGMKGVAGITGMALDPYDHTLLYAGTRSNGGYKLTNIRGSGGSSALASSPNRIEEMATIGNGVYAAADSSGVYKVTNSGGTWTKLGGSFFPSTAEYAAIGGSGSTIYVGGANTAAGQTVAKSTDGGSTWKWVPAASSNVSITPWGTTDQWWLAKAVPRVTFGCYNGGCTYESTSIAVDQFNPNIVYSAGRSGVWKSEDGGANWRPSVNHLAGTMHTNLAAGTAGLATVDDVDWTNESTSDYFHTVQQGSNVSLGSASLSITKGGHTYNVQLGVPRDITMDGQSIADEYFRAGVNRPRDIDVSADGNYIYIAQFGGGVMVGHKGSVVVDNPPTVSLGTVSSPASGTVTLTATAQDDIAVSDVTFSYKPASGSTWATIGTLDTSSPYTASWDTSSLTPGGTYNLRAVARDSSGQTATSASATVTIAQQPPPSIPGDCAGTPGGGPDGRVNAVDLSALLSHDNASYPPCDFTPNNGTSVIGSADLAVLLAHWTW